MRLSTSQVRCCSLVQSNSHVFTCRTQSAGDTFSSRSPHKSLGCWLRHALWANLPAIGGVTALLAFVLWARATWRTRQWRNEQVHQLAQQVIHKLKVRRLFSLCFEV